MNFATPSTRALILYIKRMAIVLLFPMCLIVTPSVLLRQVLLEILTKFMWP